MKKSIIGGVAAIFFCFFIYSGPLQAEHNVSRLTKENIRAFIHDMTDRANKARSSSNTESNGFFDNHLHPKAFFKSSVIYEVPGYPAQQSSITFDKSEYIHSLFNTKNMSQDFEAEVQIQQIKISKDKTRAILKTTTVERAMMIVPQSESTEHVPMNGNSTCDQILSLADNQNIQVYSANCTTKISFEQIY